MNDTSCPYAELTQTGAIQVHEGVGLDVVAKKIERMGMKGWLSGYDAPAPANAMGAATVIIDGPGIGFEVVPQTVRENGACFVRAYLDDVTVAMEFLVMTFGKNKGSDVVTEHMVNPWTGGGPVWKYNITILEHEMWHIKGVDRSHPGIKHLEKHGKEGGFTLELAEKLGFKGLLGVAGRKAVQDAVKARGKTDYVRCTSRADCLNKAKDAVATINGRRDELRRKIVESLMRRGEKMTAWHLPADAPRGYLQGATDVIWREPKRPGE